MTRYTIRFVIRGQDLLLKASGQDGEGGAHEDVRSGRLLVGVKAFDAAGNAVNWAAGQENVSLEPGELGQVSRNGISARLDIDLPAAQDLQLVTAVIDANSEEAGTLTLGLQAAAAAPHR